MCLYVCINVCHSPALVGLIVGGMNFSDNIGTDRRSSYDCRCRRQTCIQSVTPSISVGLADAHLLVRSKQKYFYHFDFRDPTRQISAPNLSYGNLFGEALALKFIIKKFNFRISKFPYVLRLNVNTFNCV